MPNETPVVITSDATLADCVHDPPVDAAFPEVVVVDELSQVQKDIQELSKSCLISKIFGEPLDVHTIISRT